MIAKRDLSLSECALSATISQHMVLGDEVVYCSEPIPGAHPRHIAAVAKLLGVTAPDPCHARVLELACATGSNLLSIASDLPTSECIGIDISAREVAVGSAEAARLGLRNVRFVAVPIEKLDRAAGKFDFIICHGTYSWVPEAVRQDILRVFQEHLSPRGIAYLSYNTYPGWRGREIVRDLMYEAGAAEPDLMQRARTAKRYTQFVKENLKGKNGDLDSYVRGELQQALGMADWYLLHDYLAPVNQPFYVRQVLSAAAQNGLAYLGDAEVSTLIPQEFPAAVRQELNTWAADSIAYEQLLDFMRNRFFRRSLFILGTEQLRRLPSARAVPDLWFTSLLKPIGPINLLSNDSMEFRQPDGGAINTADPLLKAAISTLIRSGDVALSFEQLWQAAMQQFPDELRQKILATRTKEHFAEQLMPCIMADLMKIYASG